MSWEESLQSWIGKGLDTWAANERLNDENDAAYEVERLRLLQRNPYGQPYYEGQPTYIGGQGQGLSVAGLSGGKLLLIGAAVVVLMLATRKG